MKREIVLEKSLFKRGMELFAEWDKIDSDNEWEPHKKNFDEFAKKVHYLWDSIFTGLDSDAIDYIRDAVVGGDLEKDYLQYSDLVTYEEEYLGDCDKVSSTLAVCGLALLKTVCDVIEPWKSKEMLKELNKEVWDLDDSLIEKAVEIYTAYYDKGCSLHKEDKERLGFYEFQDTVNRKWFDLFTSKATDEYVYEMRNGIVEKYYGESYDLNDVKNLIESYKNNKEFFFPEMLATLSDMCAKMFTLD